MANRLQLRKGTTAQNTAFTGANGELTYDTQKKQIRVHDGSTVGGKIIDDTARDVTGQVKQATESLAGKAKIATTAIAQAGVNDTDFITAKKLRGALNATGNAPIIALRAKGYINMSGASIESFGGENIASITRVSSGTYRVTTVTDLPDLNYVVFGTILEKTQAYLAGVTFQAGSTRTTKEFTITTKGANSTGTDYSKIWFGVA